MIQNGDFIKLDYTGKLPDGTVFDTTREDDAKAAGISGSRESAPITICVGEGMLLKGIDNALEGKEFGTHTITLKPEEAFGKKDPKLLRIVPTEQLKKQGIRPEPGMQLNIDGGYGLVKSTGGGRTVVDFNHPLASKEVSYDIEVLGKVEQLEEQIKALVAPLGVETDVAIEKQAATITLPSIPPKPVMDMLQKKIIHHTPVTTVHFEAGKK